VPVQNVTKGNKASKPADPTRSGYTFKGWYVGNAVYDFNSPVTGNVWLTAKWEQVVTPPPGPSGPQGSRSLTSAKAPGLDSIAWTGGQLKPEPTIQIGSDTLTKGVDYSLSYGANKNIGKGKVTVTGKGNYKGSKTFSFKIVPKTVKIKKVIKQKRAVKVTWTKTNKKQKVKGYQIHYRQKGKKAWSLKTFPAKAGSAVIKKLKKGKTYEIRLRSYKKVGSLVYYSKWSPVKKIKAK
jgi:uncharacterized repeat protein (TIGR02543 family)